MPNKDKTGPQGKGPRTGRCLGDCKENEILPLRGRGLGQGRGRGRGLGPRGRF
jgi:hypothetical protein